METKKIILRTFQSPGDVLMLTAAVRDLHLANPGRFQTDVRTSADAIWEHNPHVTRLSDSEAGVHVLDVHYPLIQHSNNRPLHFIHGYPQYLEAVLGVRIPVTAFRGDIHLTSEERRDLPRPGGEAFCPGGPYWIVMAGGKYDFTAKWWNPESFQQVVDHFAGRIQFVQCGEAGHWHPRLRDVIDLVGKTSLRDFIRLVHHADGVLCPVTLAMHLAAAVPTRAGRPPRRACVVVAGGREPPHWEAYPDHQYISTAGALACCAKGGCWKSRCQLVGDGDEKDRTNLCEQPVQVSAELRIGRCMEMITPQDVIRRIEMYYDGGALKYAARGERPGERLTEPAASRPNSVGFQPARSERVEPADTASLRSPAGPNGQAATAKADEPAPPPPAKDEQHVLIGFRHGLGDAVQLTSLLAHVRHYHPDWKIDVAAQVGKQSIYNGQCHGVHFLGDSSIDHGGYQRVYNLDWHECSTSYDSWPSTKVERCLLEVFGLKPVPELCRYTLHVGEAARQAAREYLHEVCGPEQSGPSLAGRFPAVLIHYQANTSADLKDLAHDLVRGVCDDLVHAGYVPVILDWDNRTPLADGLRIHNPGVNHPLWSALGTGDAEVLAALIAASTLVIGVDSGPLHVAGATTTPTIAVWTGHHPLHYFGLADNVLHLVPRSHASLLRGNKGAGLDYFVRHYRHETYASLEGALRKAAWRHLPADADGLLRVDGFWIRGDNALQDLVIVGDIAGDDSYRSAEFGLLSGNSGPGGEGPVVLDVGAHIGVFSRTVYERYPAARIIAVECCPENIAALKRNVGQFAQVVQAALTYQAEVALLNAVYPDCVSTGGSTIIERSELERTIEAQNGGGADPRGVTRVGEYWADLRAIRTLTLEDILEQHGAERIDILKLDCEGSEFSILENTSSLERIDLVVGEYHGRERFDELVARRFPGWQLRILSDGDPGTFWLINPARRSVGFQPACSEPAEPADRSVGFQPANRSERVESTLPSADDFWAGFEKIVHPIDRPLNEAWRGYYGRLFSLAAELKPKTVCEIGVRAGYSAYAILSANPQSSMLGIDADLDETGEDTHGGRQGLWRHACEILAPFDYQLILVDSHAIRRLPRADLVYIDGDHTSEGCLADLRLAERSTNRILVDDYDLIPSVKAACEQFGAEHPEFSRRYIDNGLTGLVLFERSGGEQFPRCSLVVDGRRVSLSVDYSLKFLEHPDGPATPVLYHCGRRVIKAWSLRLEHDEPADTWGISGGRD